MDQSTDHDSSREHDSQPTFSTFQEVIQAAYDELSPKQHQLAQYFAVHEDIIAFASASEIGNAVGVSAATVVRFARALGYSGFTDLQDHVRSTFSKNRTASQKLAERIQLGKFSGDAAATITQINTHNIQETMRQVVPEVLHEAVTAILNAERIRIFAGGMSAAAAVMFEHSLLMLGMPARAIINGGLTQTLEIAALTERDVVIVVSIWRYLKDTVDAARYARQRGATIVSLTDSPVSAVARASDYVFVALTESAAHSSSMTGMMSLIDLINATIISRRPEQSTAALKRVDDSYYEQGRLTE